MRGGRTFEKLVKQVEKALGRRLSIAEIIILALAYGIAMIPKSLTGK